MGDSKRKQVHSFISSVSAFLTAICQTVRGKRCGPRSVSPSVLRAEGHDFNWEHSVRIYPLSGSFLLNLWAFTAVLWDRVTGM